MITIPKFYNRPTLDSETLFATAPYKRLAAAVTVMAFTLAAQAQVRGTIIDKQTDEPLSFVTVQIHQADTKALVGGGMSDVEGKFRVEDLKAGKYVMTLSYIGYKDLTREFELVGDKPARNFNRLYMAEDAHQLKEVEVTYQRSTMKLEVDRKSFDVSQMVSVAGQSASELLENIPSVEVDNDGNVSLRGNSSVEVWINGKASGLTTDNRATILQQIPAETIERVEVIDNPSAKYSAEGSAGIINIILKKDRAAGYYGSLQVGGNTHGMANTSANINYNSSLLDAYASIGYRHHEREGHSESEQINYANGLPTSYSNYNSTDASWGNNIFTRAGITLHATKKDDFTLSGMLMKGGHNDRNTIPYYYGSYAADGTTYDNYTMTRQSKGRGDMRMLHGEADWTHQFSEDQKLVVNFSMDRWKSDNANFYRDHTDYSLLSSPRPDAYVWQSRPLHINNRNHELKLEYENKFSENFKLEAGYNWRKSHENTPQQSYEAASYDGTMPAIYNAVDPDGDYSAYEDQRYFNRFIYDNDVHAFYLTANRKLGNFSLMAGLRAEYWKVNTDSYDWQQEYGGKAPDATFEKDYFSLFPSIFAAYQLTPNDQLQLNYTRRLRRPWGGQLNSFRDTRDATMISFGNPELTPEYSNSFSLNYLRTWTEHSMLLSLYYRPTSDVMQRISYRDLEEDIMYATTMNVASSKSSGAEITVKNKLWRRLDLTTNVNAYYYKLNDFSYVINGQTVTGDERKQFTWNARVQASLMLPYDISVQTSANYRSRQAITQGHRPSIWSMDLGARKNFFNKMFTLSINCRDLLNTRKWESETSSDTFWRYQQNRRNSRNVSATLTWNFGNSGLNKKRPRGGEEGGDMPDYNGMEE